MPPPLFLGRFTLVIGIGLTLVGLEGYRDHLALPGEMDVGAHPIWWDQLKLGFGIVITLVGVWHTVRERPERREWRRRKRELDF